MWCLLTKKEALAQEDHRQLLRLRLDEEIARRQVELDQMKAVSDALAEDLQAHPPEKHWPLEELNTIHWHPGHDDLSQWFGLSYAGWLTLPRVLMEAMPDWWQAQMAHLLEIYGNTWTNWNDDEEFGTRVQFTKDGKFVKGPEWLSNYRHPDYQILNRLRASSESSYQEPTI